MELEGPILYLSTRRAKTKIGVYSLVSSYGYSIKIG